MIHQLVGVQAIFQWNGKVIAVTNQVGNWNIYELQEITQVSGGPILTWVRLFPEVKE